jgi:hypothetical protein
MDKIFVYAKLSGFAPRENGQLPSTAEYAVKGFQRALCNRLDKRYEVIRVEVQHVADDSLEEIFPSIVGRDLTTEEHEEMVQYVKDCIKQVYDDHRFWKQGILEEIDDAFNDVVITTSTGRFHSFEAFLAKVRVMAKHADNQELVERLKLLYDALHKVYEVVEQSVEQNND